MFIITNVGVVIYRLLKCLPSKFLLWSFLFCQKKLKSRLFYDSGEIFLQFFKLIFLWGWERFFCVVLGFKEPLSPTMLCANRVPRLPFSVPLKNSEWKSCCSSPLTVTLILQLHSRPSKLIAVISNILLLLDLYI